MMRKTPTPRRASKSARPTPPAVSTASPRPTKMYVFLKMTLRLVGPDDSNIELKIPR
jgi:hypothetical protein